MNGPKQNKEVVRSARMLLHYCQFRDENSRNISRDICNLFCNSKFVFIYSMEPPKRSAIHCLRKTVIDQQLLFLWVSEFTLLLEMKKKKEEILRNLTDCVLRNWQFFVWSKNFRFFLEPDDLLVNSQIPATDQQTITSCPFAVHLTLSQFST
jgi:hypothetical protein